MIRRRRQARFPPAAAAAGGDIEALQTDVMRFLSIIGLCLMAIFALVQGIPVQQPGKPVQPAQAARPHQDIRAQKEQQLDALRERLLDTQVQLDRSRREIETLKHRSRQQAEQPAAKPVIKKRTPPVPAAKPVIEKQPPAAPAVKPLPPGKGFTLRFSSAAALDRLVTAGSVALYGMADQQAWRLSMDAGRPVVARASFPQWFHEMAALTVPAHYLHSLEGTADGPAQSGVVWGVQLPAATRTAIAALTRGQPGGVLVIRGNGQVILEE